MKFVRMIDDYVNDKKFSMIYKNNKLDIINYSEITHFSSSLISVRYDTDIYQVKGDNLVIVKMMEEEILITGCIGSIIFDRLE